VVQFSNCENLKEKRGPFFDVLLMGKFVCQHEGGGRENRVDRDLHIIFSRASKIITSQTNKQTNKQAKMAGTKATSDAPKVCACNH
jgi:hypothetical protein